MRIAVLIVGIALSLVMAGQAVLVFAGGSLIRDDGISSGGAFALFLAFLMFVAAAFVLGIPLVSVVLYYLVGVLGILAGLLSSYRDLLFWGVVAMLLGAGATLGWREQHATRRRARLQEDARDAAHRRLIREVAASNAPTSQGFPETGNPSVRT